ncbi:MAG: hypothetical protein DIU56_007885 [Pseudomonadota bacterium]|jgi:hypothetical protein|nr:MAG: hypothetical protein DIU56_03165 [Pseudomonadota bacterium]
MTRIQREDFYEVLEQLAQELAPLQRSEEAALRRLLSAPPAERERLLEEYLAVLALTEGCIERRRRFLESYRP